MIHASDGSVTRTVRDIQRLCYAGLDALTLRQQAMDTLAQTLTFDAFCCSTADPMSRFFTHTIVGGRDESALVDFVQHVLFEDDINDYAWMARTRHTVALLSEGTQGRLDRSLTFREILGPRGHAHQARSVFMVRDELWGGLELSRERQRPDFDGQEVALIKRIAPHLGAGLKAAALRSNLYASSASDHRLGLLTLNQRQQITHGNAAAMRWLSELGSPTDARGTTERAPQPISMLLAVLQRTLAPRTESDASRVPQLHVQTPSGQWLSLTADVDIVQGDAPSGAMVLIEPIGPREQAWLRRSAYCLTRREQEVVELVVRGMSTHDIAMLLCITEYTVQDHLSHVFEKVGVRSRRQLIKRLFFDFMAENAPHE